GYEFSGRPPSCFAVLNAQCGKMTHIYLNRLGPLLANGKFWNGQNKFYRRPGLIQETTYRRLEIENALWERSERCNHSVIVRSTTGGQCLSNESCLPPAHEHSLK